MCLKSFFKSCQNELKPHVGILSFAFIFLFALLPQFFIIQQPIFHCDSHLYVMQANDIFHLKIPFEGYDMDFPYGFGIFIALNYFLGGNLFTVIITQSIIQFLLLLWLINLVKKYHGIRASLAVGALFGLFFTISEMLLWNSLIYTESLFISTLIFTGGQLYKFIYEENKRNLYYVFLGIFLSMLMRSNASFLFFIPVLAFLVRKNIRKEILLFVSLLLISLSITNYVFRGSFSPLETKRYVDVFKQLHSTHIKGEIQQVEDPSKKRTVVSQAKKLFTNLGKSEMGNHYYYRVPRLLVEEDSVKFRKSHLKTDNSVNYHVAGYPFNHQDYFQFATKGISGTKEKKNLCDIDIRPRNPILLLLNYYHFVRFFIRNHLLTFLFYVSFFYCLFFYFKDKKNKTLQSGLIFSLIHLVSIFLLALHSPKDTSLTRYAIVTELFCYLTIVLAIVEFSHKRNPTNE